MAINDCDDLARMRRGEMYHALSPQILASRSRCFSAVGRYNRAGDLTRREAAQYWKEITGSNSSLPPPGDNEEEEHGILHEYPWIERPIQFEHGTNVKVGSNVFINSNCYLMDACTISIGSRTLIGPNVVMCGGSHPVDPNLRKDPNVLEFGSPVTIGEDCWIGANVVILPGVTVGDGSTVGAGSVVTKDVLPYHVVAGNPARILRKLERKAEVVPDSGSTDEEAKLG